jgi:hypothetical protein
MSSEDIGTHPHLCPLDLPFVSVTFVSSPFCLEEMKDAGEGKVLAVLRRRWRNIRILRTRLLLWWLLWLLVAVVLLLLGVGLEALQRTQHGELNGGRLVL